jgi:hypothetical protein
MYIFRSLVLAAAMFRDDESTSWMWCLRGDQQHSLVRFSLDSIGGGQFLRMVRETWQPTFLIIAVYSTAQHSIMTRSRIIIPSNLEHLSGAIDIVVSSALLIYCL